MNKVAFQLGVDTIHAVVHQFKSTSPTMLNVHEDETTSISAGKVSIEEQGGRLIQLEHAGTRLITFRLERQKYTFDPNRIFSDPGIETTLRKHVKYSTAAHEAIKGFATEYLQRFDLNKECVIIALHNTMDPIFSIETFLPSGRLGSDAAAMHVNPRRHKMDFFYVTEPGFFDFLKARNFNVVLQDNDKVTDDGSLSVYFSRKGIPYVNIEAEMGRLKTQIEMVQAVREMIGQ